jgi:hypothetical protein
MLMYSIRIIFLSVAAMALLSSCVIRARPGVAVYADVPVVTVAPPAPEYEVVPEAPYPGYVWIDGAWLWEGGEYRWHRGHWEAPREGFHWVPHTWVREGNGWRMQGGRWERR